MAYEFLQTKQAVETLAQQRLGNSMEVFGVVEKLRGEWACIIVDLIAARSVISMFEVYSQLASNNKAVPLHEETQQLLMEARGRYERSEAAPIVTRSYKPPVCRDLFNAKMLPLTSKDHHKAMKNPLSMKKEAARERREAGGLNFYREAGPSFAPEAPAPVLQLQPVLEQQPSVVVSVPAQPALIPSQPMYVPPPPQQSTYAPTYAPTSYAPTTYAPTTQVTYAPPQQPTYAPTTYAPSVPMDLTNILQGEPYPGVDGTTIVVPVTEAPTTNVLPQDPLLPVLTTPEVEAADAFLAEQLERGELPKLLDQGRDFLAPPPRPVLQRQNAVMEEEQEQQMDVSMASAAVSGSDMDISPSEPAYIRRRKRRLATSDSEDHPTLESEDDNKENYRKTADLSKTKNGDITKALRQAKVVVHKMAPSSPEGSGADGDDEASAKKPAPKRRRLMKKNFIKQ